MEKELFEELLGREASDVLQDALDRHGTLFSPVETEAVLAYQADPNGLSERHRESLNELLTAISDDFTVRRRAVMLRTLMTPPVPEDDDWIPEDEDKMLDSEGRPKQLPKGGDEEDLADFLETLDED